MTISRMCFRGSWAAAAVAGLMGVAAPSRVGAQELALVAVRASSDNVELPKPNGFGAFAEFDLAPWRLRVTYVRYGDDTQKAGLVCRVYSPRIGCRTEWVATSAHLSGLRLTVVRALRLTGRLEVSAGGGLSFNQLGVTSTGTSGGRADLHMPNSGQIGYVGTASAALTPMPGIPVRVVGGASGHWVRFRGCVSAEDKTSGYAPFCGWNRFTEVQLGVSVVVPRR